MAVDLFGDWATVAGVLATLVLAGTAVWAGRKAAREVREELRIQQHLHREQRVFELQGTLSSRDFIEMSAKAADFINAFRADEAGGRTKWQQVGDTLEKMEVLAVLNFYELVATEYNADTLDRTAADSYLGYAAVYYWAYAQPFVEHLRSLDRSFFAEWQHFMNSHSEAIKAAAKQHLDSYDAAEATAGKVAASRVAVPQSTAKLEAGVQHSLASVAPPVGKEFHIPGPTLLPLLTAVAITLILIGATTTVVFSIAGALLLAAISTRWIKDTRSEMDQLPWDHRR